MSIHPLLRDAVREGIEHCDRLGGTGLRQLSGHHAVWDELEGLFATYAGTEAALFFNSGFAANTSLLSSILGPEDVVFSDQLNHASIIDGIGLSRAQKIIYPHGDLNFLDDAAPGYELRTSNLKKLMPKGEVLRGRPRSQQESSEKLE